MDVATILASLAESDKLYGLPNYWSWSDPDAPTAAARLHCFASARKWLLVGEELYYDRDQWGSHDAFMHTVHAFGTGANHERHIFPRHIQDGDAPLFLEDEDGPIDDVVNVKATNVRVRDTTVKIQRNRPFLAKHAIVVVKTFNGAHLYRSLCSAPSVRKLLLASPAEVRKELGISKALREILVLDDWAAPEDHDAFAESECARLLAEVMVHKDPKRYRPKERPNMHWRHHLKEH